MRTILGTQTIGRAAARTATTTAQATGEGPATDVTADARAHQTLSDHAVETVTGMEIGTATETETETTIATETGNVGGHARIGVLAASTAPATKTTRMTRPREAR